MAHKLKSERPNPDFQLMLIARIKGVPECLDRQEISLVEPETDRATLAAAQLDLNVEQSHRE